MEDGPTAMTVSHACDARNLDVVSEAECLKDELLGLDPRRRVRWKQRRHRGSCGRKPLRDVLLSLAPFARTHPEQSNATFSFLPAYGTPNHREVPDRFRCHRVAFVPWSIAAQTLAVELLARARSFTRSTCLSPAAACFVSVLLCARRLPR
jgi:hypothetical protein